MGWAHHPLVGGRRGVQSAGGPHHLPGRLRRLVREGGDGSGARSAVAVADQPANYPFPGPIEYFEGIVATERWFAPRFTNLRITKTDQPVRINADLPLVQAQPIPAELPDSTVLDDMRVHVALAPEDWAAYVRTLVEPYSRPTRPFGAYAAVERQKGRRSGIGAIPRA